MLTTISGQIDKITFFNEENSFTIARVKVKRQQSLITVLGNIASPKPGELLTMKGEWVKHPKYGNQFKIAEYETAVPVTEYGIRKYLGSGLIKGIGDTMAERIVDHFGNETLDIIEKNSERLAEIEGIGKKRVSMIQASWDEQKEIRQVMIFLQSHDVGSGYAAKIFKAYGTRAITKVKENPYCLAMDIAGIGFIIADNIASKLGFDKDSPLRAKAGVLYVLQQYTDDGHVFYPYEWLVTKSIEVLDVDRDIVLEAIGALSSSRDIVIEDLTEDIGEFIENNKGVFLTRYHMCERKIAERIRMLMAVPVALYDKIQKELNAVKENVFSKKPGSPDRQMTGIETVDALVKNSRRISKQSRKNEPPITLTEKQHEAVQAVLENKIAVITGGPGTGKTTILNTIKDIAEYISRLSGSSEKIKFLLAAPTGRAAKRMHEATGHEAKTIHRMLEYSRAKGGFFRDDKNPLDCDLLIIDEASMVDTILMYYLLKAVPATATLVLVGDVDQLPSVGPGNVLNDIIESNAVPVVELNEIFRQADSSSIITNAHRINRGEKLLEDNGSDNDFFFIEREDPESALKTIIDVVSKNIPSKFGFDPVNDIQVLTPMHKGLAGAENLNQELQDVLNPGEGGLIRGGRTFKVDDKVMQIKNNYDKDVFNGDIGRIIGIDNSGQEVAIFFDNRKIMYTFSELDEIVPAYAVTVHKSQGSEYPAVVMPILTQHYILLQRNLIYTGVTRGKKLVVIIGSRKAMAIGINNDKTQKRYTRLRYRLSNMIFCLE